MIDLPPISLPLVASLIVVAAAAAAVIVRDGRAVAVGLFAALLVAPFATEPVPAALQLAARAVAAVMAAYVLWVVMKTGEVKSEGSAIGPAAELAVAVGAYALGWWIQPVSPLAGPQAEQAAGFAVVALAVLPLAGGNPLRAGVGVLLVILGASMVMDAWLGQMPALGQLALTALLLAIPAAISILVDAEDKVPAVTPAIENVRPAAPVRALRVDPFGGGELEPIAAEPYPTFSPVEHRDVEDEAADDTEASTVPAVEPGPGNEPEARPPFLVQPAAAHEVASPEVEEPIAHVTGPRPSVRFLGRNAPLRHPSEASQARRPGERRLPGLGHHGDGAHGPAEAQPESAPSEGTNKPDKGLPDGTPGEASVRDNRRLRDPRFKRPLR